MSKPRQQAYFELVKALLECPEGDETLILANQPELVDEGLVRELLRVADMLAEEHGSSVPTIVWLRELASGLQRHYQQQDQIKQRQQAYSELIKALLKCPEGNEWLILANHRELIDKGLTTGLLRFADMMTAKSDSDEIWAVKWLCQLSSNLSAQLRLELASGLSTFRLAENFLDALFYAIDNSKGDVQVIFLLLQDNLAFLNDRLATVLEESFNKIGNKNRFNYTHNLGVFANAISDFTGGNRGLNLEIAIAAYYLQFKVYTLIEYPREWANTQSNLGVAYSNRIKGNLADNLELSIQCHEAVLEVSTLELFPLHWAKTQSNLGAAYSNRISGKRVDNIEQAIKCSQSALKVITKQNYPREWAITQNNLAIAYHDRICGDQSSNLELEIECYEAILGVYTQQVFPEEWAETQFNLAVSYGNRISGDKSSNIELSIKHYKSVLEVITLDLFPQKWAKIYFNLAAEYTRLESDRATNLELVIECCQSALKVYSRIAFPQEWAKTCAKLAIGYFNRICGERVANLEQSITYLQSALEVTDKQTSPKDWAEIQSSLSLIYFERIRGERSDNLEMAIKCAKFSLEVLNKQTNSNSWILAQNNLANAYSNRIYGKYSENIELSIELYEAVIEVCTKQDYPENWSLIMDNLGAAYSKRKKGNESSNIESSIKYHQAALEVRTQQDFPKEWAMTKSNLATAYLRRSVEERERADDQELSIECFESALKIFTSETFPKLWARTQEKLAIAFYVRSQGKRSENLERYIECCQSALKVFTPQSFPSDCQRVAYEFGEIMYKQSNWELAIQGCELAIQSVETSRSWASRGDSREKIVRDALDIYELAIEASIKASRIDLALCYSERARSRQLLDVMTVQDHLSSQGKPEIQVLLNKYRDINAQIQTYHKADFNNDSETISSTDFRTSNTSVANNIIRLTVEKDKIWQQICQCDPIIGGQIQVNPIDILTIQSLIPNPQTAILSFYTTRFDTFIFFITQQQQPQVHICKGLGWNNLQAWLRDTWLIPYTSDFSTWYDMMTTTLGELAHRLDLNTLITKLLDIEELIVIPHLYLHQIPFAAIPLTSSPEITKDNLNPTNNLNNYLGDRFTIRYAPSCQILKYCADRTPIEQIQYGTVEDADGTLPGARFEGQQISEIHQIPDKHRLIGKSQASIENYQQLLKQVTNVHSSHHASSSLDNPLESHLKLANGVINLRDLFNSRYPNLNEVFLSCCETNLGSTTVTDDLLTIATAFLCSGARSVISTLWSVDDLATWIFSVFYHQLRKDGVNRSTAIQKAQHQLRTLNKEQIDPLIANLSKIHNTLTTEFDSRETSQEQEINFREDLNHFRSGVDSLQKRLRSSRRQDYPFENPYYWAGFTCQGLTDVNAPTDAIFSRETTLQTSDNQQNIINSEEIQGLGTELASVDLFNSTNTANSYFEIGQRLASLNDFNGAISQFSRAIELDSNNSRYWKNRGNIYFKLEQSQKAVEDYSKALALDPNDDVLWHNRGCGYLSLNQYQKVVEDFIRAIELNPNDTTYLRNFSASVNEFERSVELDSSNEQNLLVAVSLSTPIDLLALNSPVEIDARYWNLQGMENRSSNQFAEAIENFTKAIDLNPNNDLYWYNRGGAYSNLQQHQKALEDCSKAIELNPRDPISWNGRGLTHYRLEQYHQAYINFYQASKLDFNNIEYRNNRKAANARLQSTG